MKKLFLSLLLVGFASIATSYAQTKVEIVNSTDVAIYSIFASSNNDDQWGPDLLQKTMLAPGEKLTITFPAGYDCDVDIKVSADANDEDSISFSHVDICEVAGIELFGDGAFEIY